MKAIILLLLLLSTEIAQGNDKREVVIDAYVNNIPSSQLNSNKKIDVLTDDNTSDAICDKWVVEIPYENSENSLLFVLIIIAIVIIFTVWILRLGNKIRRSEREAELAKTVLQKYTETINNLSNSCIRVFLTDLKDNKKSVLKKEKSKLIENGVETFLESIHPEDRAFYVEERECFISDKLASATIPVRMLDVDTNKYNLHELILNSVARDKAGKVYKFTTIARKETQQDEMIYKQSKDLHNLNMAIKSVKLIRWDVDIINSTINIVNINNKEYVYTYKELIKKIDPKNYKQLRGLVAQIRSAKAIGRITMDIDLFDTGSYQSYEIMTTIECSDNGSPCAVFGIVRDVTKMKKYQKLLRNELLLNKIISKHVSVGVGFYDKDGVCRSLNTKALELLGFDEKKALNSDVLLDFLYISAEEKAELQSGGSVTYHVTNEEIRRRYKKYLSETDSGLHGELISTNCSSVFNDANELIGYVSVYTDITEITRSRENVLELKTRVELALSAGGDSAWIYRRKDDSYAVLNGLDKVLRIAQYHKEVIATFHPDDVVIQETAMKAILTRQSEKEIFVIRTIIDNELSTYRLTIVPREQDGEVEHVVGIVKDISEQVKAEQEIKSVNTLLGEKNAELHYNVTLLKEIIDSLPGAVYIKDINSDLKYYLANDNFCRDLANRPISEIIGYSDSDILPKGLACSCCSSDAHCIKMNVTTECDEEVVLDGVKSMWRTVKTPVSLTNDMKLLICMSIDVTELYRMKERAEESDKLKSQFLENMSHEIRTPLNAIVGFSSLLISTDEEDIKQEFNDIITANSELLLNLINDILDLSKMESGIVNFKDEFFDVNALLEETHLSFSMRASENVVVKYEKLDETINAKIDKMRIRQVLNNYLSNALKFTKSGEIVFGCRVERGGLRLFVKDTGIGISDENKAKVFKRFEKLDTFAQGTGLGLSICKVFVDLKQGEVGFDSVVGEGSHFWIWIPCEINVTL